MLDQVRRREAEFDIVHLHIDLLPFPLFRNLSHKTVLTLHGRLDMPDFWPVYDAYPEMPLISVSDDQRTALPFEVNWLATVHHGLPNDVCPFDPEGGDYLAFLGRISPEKRPDRAIEIAKRTGVPLKIAAKVDKADQEYYDRQIRPLLEGCDLVEFIGEVNEQEKCSLLGKARALLFPIDWPEPFGLVMIEAMSTGTPVIAWRKGSVPEVIADGQSGFIVDSIEDAITAVDAAAHLNRYTVRRHFDSRFTAAEMASAYVKAYQSLIHSDRAPQLQLVASA